MKYKLIKEYPGSAELGTEVESNSKSSSSYFYRSGDKRICVFNDHVEENPEYWEKVEQNIYYVVIEDIFNHGNGFHRPYEIHNVETLFPEDIEENLWGSVKKNIFKTKEEAEYFILTNKPCLSYNDVSDFAINFDETGVYYKVYTEKLKEIIKSRL